MPKIYQENSMASDFSRLHLRQNALSNQKVSVRNNILENKFVSKSMSKLYLSSDLADVHFLIENQKVPAHKIILAVANPVFFAMFFGSLPEKGDVKITDTNIGAFKEFLQFFYLAEVTLTMENIEEVARLADKYDMLDCMNMCAAFLESKLTDDNMFWGYRLAISLKNYNLKRFCETNISIRPLEVFRSEAFLRCDHTILKNILMIDSLMCEENDVFMACMKWSEYHRQKNGYNDQPVNLRSQLGDCFQFIRFGLIPSEKFAGHLPKYKDLFTRDELADVLCTTAVPNYQSTKFNNKPRTTPFNLICDCTYEYDTRVYQKKVQRYESVWFTSSVDVLLGKLEFVHLSNPQNVVSNRTELIINVFEVNPKTWEPVNTLFTSDKLTLDKDFSNFFGRPPKIYALKTYKIQMEIQMKNSNVYANIFHTSEFKYGAKEVNEDLTITFIDGSYSGTQSGLISKLHFCKI